MSARGHDGQDTQPSVGFAWPVLRNGRFGSMLLSPLGFWEACERASMQPLAVTGWSWVTVPGHATKWHKIRTET